MTVEEKLDKLIDILYGRWKDTKLGKQVLKLKDPKPEPEKWWMSRRINDELCIYSNPNSIHMNSDELPDKYVTLHNRIEVILMFLKHLRPDLTLPEPGECVQIPPPKGDALIEKIGELKKENEDKDKHYEKLDNWAEKVIQKHKSTIQHLNTKLATKEIKVGFQIPEHSDVYQRLKQQCKEFEDRFFATVKENEKLKKQNEILAKDMEAFKKVSEDFNVECNNLRKQSHKMKECLEAAKIFLTETPEKTTGILAAICFCLDSLDEAINDQ